jgi:hypothetical protein
MTTLCSTRRHALTKFATGGKASSSTLPATSLHCSRRQHAAPACQPSPDRQAVVLLLHAQYRRYIMQQPGITNGNTRTPRDQRQAASVQPLQHPSPVLTCSYVSMIMIDPCRDGCKWETVITYNDVAARWTPRTPGVHLAAVLRNFC